MYSQRPRKAIGYYTQLAKYGIKEYGKDTVDGEAANNYKKDVDCIDSKVRSYVAIAT